MSKFNDDDCCFVCGKRNLSGLQIDFSPSSSGSGIRVEIMIPKRFQGWENVVHGGIISTLLDEAMIKAAGLLGFPCVTGELSVRFRHPAPVDTKLILEARVDQERGRVLRGSACLKAGERELATGNAILFKIAPGT